MFRTKPFFNADAGADSGNGGTPPTPPTDPANSGDAGSPAPEAEAKEFEDLVAKGDALTEAEKARFETLKGKFEISYTDAEGKPLTPEQIQAVKETEAKVSAILAKPEDQRTPEEVKFLEENTEPETKENVYTQVNKLRGIEDDDINYGDVDPLSPEGIALREDILERRTIESWEASFQAKFPRAYQFALHLQQGGTEDDFFKPENQNFRAIQLDQNDKKGQEKLLRDALRAKSMSPEIIDAAVTSLKDSGKLFEAATKELEALQEAQARQEAERVKAAKAAEAKRENDWNQFYDGVEDTLKKGFGGSVIPTAEHKPFLDFLSKQLDYHEGRFFKVQQLDPKELDKFLKVAYFDFKGGNLTNLIEKKAASKIAVKLKSKIKQTVTPKQSNGKRFVPLSEI